MTKVAIKVGDVVVNEADAITVKRGPGVVVRGESNSWWFTRADGGDLCYAETGTLRRLPGLPADATPELRAVWESVNGQKAAPAAPAPAAQPLTQRDYGAPYELLRVVVPMTARISDREASVQNKCDEIRRHVDVAIRDLKRYRRDWPSCPVHMTGLTMMEPHTDSLDSWIGKVHVYCPACREGSK